MENVLENTAMRHSINLITPLHCKIKSQGVKMKQGRKNCYVKGFPEFLKPTWINRKSLESSSAVYPIYSTLKEDKLQLYWKGFWDRTTIEQKKEQDQSTITSIST